MSQDTESNNPHTSAEEGHPAGEGERSDRDIGGPTAPENPPDDDVEGGGPSTRPAEDVLAPHESAEEAEADLPEPEGEESDSDGESDGDESDESGGDDESGDDEESGSDSDDSPEESG